MLLRSRPAVSGDQGSRADTEVAVPVARRRGRHFTAALFLAAMAGCAILLPSGSAAAPVHIPAAVDSSIRAEWFEGTGLVSIITESRALHDPRIHRSSALQCSHQGVTRGRVRIPAQTAGSRVDRDAPTPLHGTGSRRDRCVV